MHPGSRGWNNILFHHLKNSQTLAVGYLICYLSLYTGRMNERLKGAYTILALQVVLDNVGKNARCSATCLCNFG